MMVNDAERRSNFAALIDIWNGGTTNRVTDLITDDYKGHMLHLLDGERGKSTYTDWISNYQKLNPGTIFTLQEQHSLEDGLLSRLLARREDGSHANGINHSRFVGNLIAEETAIWSNWFPTANYE